MARKKVHRGGIVSDKCFRLLRLKHEIQTDVKVLKAVVDEVDVLRLCRSLGMTLSDEGNSTAKHEFEFGLFNSCDYDADFARFIREKFVAGNGSSVQQDGDLLEIGCLFGKQLEVKAELARLGCWSGECQQRLSLEDQGVYCIERGDGGADRRQLVVFAWLEDCLFEPEAVRDTPAYVLRFLISLSSNITCCLSEEDFRRIKNEVDAASDTSSMQWKSCSVAFRVQKQVEQRDSISCGQLLSVLNPKSKRAKSVRFVGGAFAAIAVESKVQATTEWVNQSDLIPYAALAEWLLEQRKTFAVHLPKNYLLPSYVRDELLSKCDCFPGKELNDLRCKVDEQQEQATARIDRDISEKVKKDHEDAVRDARWLFAVRCAENTTQMDSAQRKYERLVRQLEKNGVFKTFDYEAYNMIYLPERIQNQMKVLSDALEQYQFAFEDVLNGVIAGDPAITEEASRRWLGGQLLDVVRGAFSLVWRSDPQYSSKFRLAMEAQQPRLLRLWSEAVEMFVNRMHAATYEERLQRSTMDREKQHSVNAEAVLQAAFDRLCGDLKSGEGRLRIEISRMALASDGTAVNITWRGEKEKEPSKVIRMFQLQDRSTAPSLMGRMEFEPGVEILKLETVKLGQVVAILGKESSTIVRRIQFPLQPKASVKAEQLDVRTFPRACSLCSVRASDRRVAFLFGVGEGRLGSVAFCRFNESFTGVEATSNVDLDAYFGLTVPLVDILLTDRSLCAVDGNGDMQAFDVRTRRASKKVSCESDGSSESKWVGGLLSFADELVVGRVSFDGGRRLSIKSISNEDHREMPTATLELPTASKELDVGCMDDVLFVVDSVNGSIYSSELSVTVRSDAYRIQRSRNGAKGTQSGRLRTDPESSEDAAGHWLRVFFHMFEKFPVRSLVDMTMNPDVPFSLKLDVVVAGAANSEEDVDGTALCVEYFDTVMADLRRLNKPLSGLNLTKTLTCRSSEQVHDDVGLQCKSIRLVLMAIISFVPVQICRAEDNMLKLLQDGEDLIKTTRASDGTSSGDESDAKSTDAAEIAQSIRFGLLSPLLETWNGRCVVVTSMGKQSTGKSYFLNHLAGTSFAISGSRCTDGAWMSLRFVSADVLLVVLDFEGLGSFERSEQEDIFLSVLNASVSMFTVFRMECRFDKDIDSLFSRFQKGVQLIKNDSRLFRGLLYMSVKDVNMNDRQGVVDELVAKLDVIFESNRDQNFLTEMYAGQLEINCSPPFGTTDYFHCMENDAARTLCSILSPRMGTSSGFVTGKSFLDCLRIVLAKISILDWTSMDKSSHNLAVADVKQKLPGILRTGCLVPQSLVTDVSIPSHLKESVLHVGSHETIVVLLHELSEENASLASKWMALDAAVPLDEVKDEEIDFGFDVTTLAGTDVSVVEKVIGELFHQLLTLQGKQYGLSRLMTEDQSNLDAFLAFILRRRRAKVTQWLCGTLGDQLSDVRSQLEQRYVAPLMVYLSRCQHRCTRCQLGCMLSVMHSSEVEHTCNTDHVCRGVCEYSECLEGEVNTPPCSRGAGHEGKCECEKGEHTCGKSCELAEASNCDKTCSKRADHSGEHRCSVQVHMCGAPCSAATCSATCLLNIQREHSVHKCAEVQCLHPCLMEGCSNVCGERDHFHGQAVESRVFAEESGTLEHCGNLADNEEVTHICSSGHACRELCAVDGICEQKVHLKKSARTYTGARGSFEYIYQEMNGCKKTCAHVLASGEQTHEGLQHSCLAREEGEEQTTVHYCDERCPSCSYYCNKRFGHMGLHATSHGNMRQTYFLAKDNDIDLDDRKYQVGERGIAEMCNLFCTKMGRGHVHFLACERKGDEKCVYLSDASKDRRRHCTDELFPPPDKAMDELLHDQFWTTIGWEDPCSDEERAVFAKCSYRCNAPDHEEKEKPSYCVLDAWHAPDLKPDGANDGFAYVDGHKFECVHAVDTGKFHNIFVLDSSGSMSGQPWQDLLCACNEFGISRLKDGGENDLVSYVTFDHNSRIFCEATLLPDALQLSVPFSGGGTSFGKGLRAANEVLSRSDFEEYKAVLIFFSDGQPCDIEQGIALAKHIRLSYAKYDLKAFAVGFGHVNLSVLKRVATELGGEYRQVLDASALRTEFQRIAAVLSKGEASLALLESSADSA